MFCSSPVKFKKKGTWTRRDPSRPPSEWNLIIQDLTSKWASDRERVHAPRNVGGARKSKWSVQEDDQLRAAIQKLGSSKWTQVATFVPGRTGKQCRERWLDKLSPDLLKDDWSAQEDSVLLAKQKELGHAWSKIREILPGRSISALKNRWNWLERRTIPNHADEFQAIVAEQITKGNADEWNHPWQDRPFEMWDEWTDYEEQDFA
jgi:hypothetical protein